MLLLLLLLPIGGSNSKGSWTEEARAAPSSKTCTTLLLLLHERELIGSALFIPVIAVSCLSSGTQSPSQSCWRWCIVCRRSSSSRRRAWSRSRMLGKMEHFRGSTLLKVRMRISQGIGRKILNFEFFETPSVQIS